MKVAVIVALYNFKWTHQKSDGASIVVAPSADIKGICTLLLRRSPGSNYWKGNQTSPVTHFSQEVGQLSAHLSRLSRYNS